MTQHITIVGLGNYGLDDLPLGIYKFLKNQPRVFTRTLEHPVIASLQDEGVEFQGFDAVYENNTTFDDVYDTIVNQLLEAVKMKRLFILCQGILELRKRQLLN